LPAFALRCEHKSHSLSFVSGGHQR
jgi:hypothetical protein